MARQKDNYYLVITESNTSDSGTYMAEASNTQGKTKSYGRLAVSSSDGQETKSYIMETESVSQKGGSGTPPEFKKLFYDKYAKLGDTVRLDAVVVGSPKPRV